MIFARLFFGIVGATAAAAIFSPAATQPYEVRQGFSADPSQVVSQTRMSYSDLDLASSARARALLRRIEAAADAVCGGQGGAVSAREKDDYETCRSAAISGAVARVRSPLLSELISRRPAERRAAQ